MRILCRRCLALILALFSISALAQTSAYKPGAPLLMWKVSSKTNSAYLLGSVHLGDKSLYPLPSTIENAFAKSSVLIVEVDMTKVDQQQLQQLMLQAGTYPEGDALARHITPATIAKLDEFLAGYGIPLEAFARYRPWMLGITVVILPLIKDGFSPDEGLDMYFLHKAGAKRIEQLEDGTWQIKLLSSFPENVSDSYLQRCIFQAQHAGDNYAKLAQYWSQGDAQKIDDLMADLSASDTPEEKAFDHRLREERNPHMADRLEKCLQSPSDSCFMVVGAAHVIGSEGILKLLQSRGYKVEQSVVAP